MQYQDPIKLYPWQKLIRQKEINEFCQACGHDKKNCQVIELYFHDYPQREYRHICLQCGALEERKLHWGSPNWTDEPFCPFCKN